MPFTKEFFAERVTRWTVDGTELVLTTDADTPPGRSRERIRKDWMAQERYELSLTCEHMSISFQGRDGTHVHGNGWLLHKPFGEKRFDIWKAVEFASLASWTEIAP